LIQFFHVSKRYPGGQTALDEVTFDIARGQFVFLTGASGAGKTTLLRMIFREEVPSSGQILVNGRNVAAIPRSKIPYLRRTIGVVFQDFRLIARKTIFENVTYLPQVLGVDLQEQKKLAYQALRRVGLAHRLNAFPPELSGGEQQRVAIARALINDPDILIADEPTGNLDPDLSREILRLFLEVNLRGTTVILATHDRDTIQRVGGRVLTLDQGRLASDQELAGTDPPVLDPLAAEAGPPGATIRHLLAHASGLPLQGQEPIAPPGTRRIYSNTGFDLLGEAIASASGISAAQYFDEAVVQPLSLAATRLKGSPASEAVSCVDDLAVVAKELLKPSILAPETLEEARAVAFAGLDGVLPGFGQQHPNDWGLGFEVRDAKQPHWTGGMNSSTTFGHFGRSGTFVWVDPELGAALVCLTDEPFDNRAKQAWPALSDVVVAELTR
jgi:cell division ATP-binding protein FtsE